MPDPTDEKPASNQGLIARVMAFLTDEGWPSERADAQMLVHTRFQGQHGQWACYAHCREGVEQCLFYSVAPVRAPEVLRPAVAEYVTRANWGLLIGNFELDYADGEVRFKTSIQLNGTELTADLLRPLIYGNVVVMDKYLPGLQAVMALTQTPSGAIRTVEEVEEHDQRATNNPAGES